MSPVILGIGASAPEPQFLDLRVTHQHDSITRTSAGYWGETDLLYISTVGATTAFRWDGLTIPRGATINSAHITMYSEWNQLEDATFYGYVGLVQADNPNRLANESEHLTRFGQIGDTLQWGPHAGLPSPDSPFTSPDIKSLLQEIVNRPGWNPGQAIMAFWQVQAGSTPSYNYHSYYSGSAGTYPRLEVEYQ